MVVQEQAEESEAGAASAAQTPAVGEDGARAVAAPAPAAQDSDRRPASPPATAAALVNDGPKPRFGIGLGGVLDAGALPSLAFGGQLELSVALAALRVGALGTLFVPQETTLAGEDRGAQFQFALGGLLVCGAPAFGDFHVLGCAGFELGSMSAKARTSGSRTRATPAGKRSAPRLDSLGNSCRASR